MKITRKIVQQANMGIKNRGRECIETEEEFYRRRGMSGRGLVAGTTELTDVGLPEKWYKKAVKQNDNTEKQKYIKSSKF